MQNVVKYLCIRTNNKQARKLCICVKGLHIIVSTMQSKINISTGNVAAHKYFGFIAYHVTLVKSVAGWLVVEKWAFLAQRAKRGV